jgi:hypothetical protein
LASRGKISRSDRALLAALSTWAGAEALPTLGRFGQKHARELAQAFQSDEPFDDLLLAHKAQIGPDPARVHPSWYVRALQEEAPSVQRVVIREAAEPLRTLLIRELAVDPDDLEPDGPADPSALETALTLWTERLVGDLPPTPDDPPAVVALTHLSPIGLYRLLRLCGIAKRVLLGETDGLDPARREFLTSRIQPPEDPRLLQIATNDVTAAASFGRHALAGLGLMTLGRLIGKVEPYRLRWALQHVPYPVAKRLRGLASQQVAAVKSVQAWELGFLNAASERLEIEGRPSLNLNINLELDRSRPA